MIFFEAKDVNMKSNKNKWRSTAPLCFIHLLSFHSNIYFYCFRGLRLQYTHSRSYVAVTEEEKETMLGFEFNLTVMIVVVIIVI